MPREKKNTMPYLVEGVFSFYKRRKRKLPWRREGISPYEVWVSEIMLQQTQVSRVVSYYARFLERFPDVETLARASWEEFLPYYEGLGYYNRGRNMIRAAQMVMEECGGEFPCKVEDLERLPGVGAYTARAVASFACGTEALAWDTNFSRVLGRYFKGSKNNEVCTGEMVKKIMRELRVSNLSARNFNAAVMDFGALVCMRNPKCGECPLASHCVYFQERGENERTAARGKDAFPLQVAQAFVILHENHKKYFSQSKKKCTPFILPPGRTSREDIKDFFLSKYALKVSVRPPKMKIYVNERPTLVVYAQVLSGKHRFSDFEPNVARDMINTWL